MVLFSVEFVSFFIFSEMLFNKYQYQPHNITKRGYSQNCIAITESGEKFWVKWILGIEKSDIKTRLLGDKLRHLQKARHVALPDIIDYGYDDEQKAFAIVYEYLEDVETLVTKVFVLENQNVISGLADIADCLQELHLKFQINHGDIQPANILIDKNGQFYLIDFGLADITKTLSQSKELEIFARGFAAPEKVNRLGSLGFPYQSDIYSLGKVIEWYYVESHEGIPDVLNIQFHKLLAENPADRPTWRQVVDFLKKLGFSLDTESVWVEFKERSYQALIIPLLNESPKFEITDYQEDVFSIDITLREVLCRAKWHPTAQKLLITRVQSYSEIPENVWKDKQKYAVKLPVKYDFSTQYKEPIADLTLFFNKLNERRQRQFSLRKKRDAVRDELSFYRDLLKEELKVITRNSLRLHYSSFKVSGNGIVFHIKLKENLSTLGFIQKHIEEGNSPDSEGFGYVISASGEKKQSKESIEFAGKPYDYNTQENLFKIKDCEYLKPDRIPQSGYLFENTNQREEEKNRQLDAIRKVEMNEVQNPDLIYYLFKPEELPLTYLDYSLGFNVYQKDEEKQALDYSANQQKAIKNALHRSPLSIIQGPPGTGKTTVITEIVFQILAQKPDAKVLITSQTNNAVDQVLENLLKNEIPIVRLSGLTAPKSLIIQKHTLSKKLEGWKQQVKEAAEKKFKKQRDSFLESLKDKNAFVISVIEIILANPDWKMAKEKIENILGRVKTLKELHQLPDEKPKAIEKIDRVLGIKFGEFLQLHQLHRDWIVTINALDEKSAINQKLIDSIRVIGATCNHIASKNYRKYNFEFDYVIMDESGKATTAEALVPITMGKNLVYVGDHRQLRPTLTKTREVEVWLRERFKKEAEGLENFEDYFNRASLFEQVINRIEPDYKSQLTECRRSSADQVKLTSKFFYELVHDEAIEPVVRDISKEHNLPLPVTSSIFFIDIGSGYKSEKDDKQSSFNIVSAQKIPEILEMLNKFEQIRNYSVGVIAGYTAQYRLLKRNIDKLKFRNRINNVTKWNKREEKLTISVVDRFQGLERDIIIIDLVKSGAGLDLGFLEVPNRVNVGLSRQKRLLIIVGDYYGLVNAKTKRLNGEKAALQLYLKALKSDWIIKAEQAKQLFA